MPHAAIASRFADRFCKLVERVIEGELKQGQSMHDSAYRSDAHEAELRESKHSSQINERAYRGVPLTEAQIASNKVKSQTRARVEHVFGYQENSMGGIGLRSIGLARAKVGKTLKNLTYNLCQVEILIRQKAVSFVRFATPKMSMWLEKGGVNDANRPKTLKFNVNQSVNQNLHNAHGKNLICTRSAVIFTNL